MTAPVALFVYKRLDTTVKCIESLQKNHLAGQSDLYIFSDAARTTADEWEVAKVREYIKKVTGFRSLNIYQSRQNMGCARSVIEGVSQILEKHDRIIVLEDDLVVTPNFLDYMNAALDFYRDKRVFSIAGWGMKLKHDQHCLSDVYFHPRFCSWGWGIWKHRWNRINWHEYLYTHSLIKTGPDLPRMLDLQRRGKIDSWAVHAALTAHKMGMPIVYPKLSKVDNIGYGAGATHSKRSPNWPVTMDTLDRKDFKLESPQINADLVKQFNYYFTIPYKIKNRLRNLL